MKHTIEWHEECHANALQCLIAKKTQLDRLRMEILRNEKELEFRTMQINEAKARGMTEFDSDRLLVSRRAIK